VIERGRHRDLLNQGGSYADMWARQQEKPDNKEAVA
jgi:ABC-type multidrug transport system fused ATPase/permease subunit